MVRLVAVVVSMLVHVGLVGTAVRIGLPSTDLAPDVIAAELVTPEPVAPPPPRRVEPPASRVVPPRPKPATPPRLIDAPPPKPEEPRTVEAPPPPATPPVATPPVTPPVAPPPAMTAPVAPPSDAARTENTAPAVTPPAMSRPSAADSSTALPRGVSAITSEPTAPARPGSSFGPAGPTAAVAPDAVTSVAIPRGGYQVRPTYPPRLQRLGVQGTTMLRVHVTADGRVGDVVVEVSAGHTDLDQAAMDAVRRWRFEPARRGSEAVAMWVRLPVEFRLR